MAFLIFSQTRAVDVEILIQHVVKSISLAEKGISKIDNNILGISGMSAAKNRHFLNNICSLENSKYFEIGTWQGSTFISALYGNEKKLSRAIAMDDFSLFDGPKKELFENFEKYLKNNKFEFYEGDCFAFDLKKIFGIDKMNIYFFDGKHSEESQRLAFEYYNEILDDVFIAIVDDWNFDQVKKGTYKAFKNLRYHVVFEKELPAQHNCDRENWWNGLYVAVIKKS